MKDLVSRIRSKLAAMARSVTRTDRRVLPFVLMWAGLALLIYVGSQYGMMYAEQRRLAREWERQQQQVPVRLENAAIVHTPSDGLTRLSIPKINLDAVVVEGTTRKNLLLGPGHLQDSAAPGEAGNSVITAHRDTFFRHIYELNEGDQILVQRDGKAYTYQVTGKKVVQPTDMSVLQESKDPRLTLITCYPTYYVGPAPGRLVVFSKLLEPQEEAVSKPRATSVGAAH